MHNAILQTSYASVCLASYSVQYSTATQLRKMAHKTYSPINFRKCSYYQFVHLSKKQPSFYIMFDQFVNSVNPTSPAATSISVEISCPLAFLNGIPLRKNTTYVRVIMDNYCSTYLRNISSVVVVSPTYIFVPSY